MVEGITGIPGGGKSSYAVLRLIKTFGKDEEHKKLISNSLIIPDVNQAYTNINEFKFYKFSNVHQYHHEDILNKLTSLHELYQKYKATDTELQDKCDELDINHAVFVIDEAHNFFDAKNKVLIWWFSYHRHLNHHIIFMTQNLSLVESKYKSFPEFFYKAVPASLKIFDTHLILKKYTSSRLSKVSETGKIKFKKFPELYDYYGAGANHNSKSVVLPYIIMSVVFLFLSLSYFLFFRPNAPDELAAQTSTNYAANSPGSNSLQSPKNRDSKIISDTYNITDKTYIKIYCSLNECFYKDISLPINFITDIKKFNSQILFKQKISTFITKYTLLIDSSLISMFDISTKNYILGVRNDDKNSTDYFNFK